MTALAREAIAFEDEPAVILEGVVRQGLRTRLSEQLHRPARWWSQGLVGPERTLYRGLVLLFAGVTLVAGIGWGLIVPGVIFTASAVGLTPAAWPRRDSDG